MEKFGKFQNLMQWLCEDKIKFQMYWRLEYEAFYDLLSIIIIEGVIKKAQHQLL